MCVQHPCKLQHLELAISPPERCREFVEEAFRPATRKRRIRPREPPRPPTGCSAGPSGVSLGPMTEQDLLRAHAAEARARDGLPTEQQEAARVGAHAEIEEALAGHLVPGGLKMSPLGPGWTDRFHARVDVLPDAAVLRAREWWALGRLLDDPTGGRCWAVVVGGRTVAAAVLSVEPHDAASVVIDRCLERGEVRLREVLELRELARSGARLPGSSRALEVAADIETGLGDRQLVRWATGRRLASPSSLPGRRRRRTAPFAMAVSGVDGSGKSSLSHELTSSLQAASVDVSHV